jgi:hypothetical protein
MMVRLMTFLMPKIVRIMSTTQTWTAHVQVHVIFCTNLAVFARSLKACFEVGIVSHQRQCVRLSVSLLSIEFLTNKAEILRY